MKIIGYLSLFYLLLFCPINIFAQCTWNGSTGNWSEDSKWSCGHVPLATDNVVINAGTITLDVAPSVANFTMTNGTIAGTNNLTINGNLDMGGGTLGNVGDATVAGTFAWKGGTIGSNDGSAAGTVTVSGATTITTNSGKGLYKKTLALNGGAEQTGSGTISFRHSCTMSLPAGKTYLANLSTNNTWNVFSGGTINNAGTFEKQGSGTLSCQPAFNNTGTVQVTAGLLNLSGGGTHSGAFSSSAGSTLEFGGGTHDLSTGTITGTGLLKISSGTVTLPANSAHDDVEATGGTAHFSGTNTMQDLTVGSCTVNFTGSLSLNDLIFTNSGSINGACPITMSGNLDMSAGNLGNVGDATVAGTFAWKGGIIGSNDGSATGTVSVSGATTITTNSGKGLYKKTLALNGGAEQTGSGTISFRHSCTMSLPAGQTYLANLSANNTWNVFSGGTINNAGTFEKQGSGTLSCQPAFNNTGTVQVTAGLLNLSGGGTHSGAFSSSAGATLEFGGGTHDLSTGTITGTGLLKISSGTVTLPANSAHDDVEATGGTAHFSGTNTMQDLTVGICTVNFAGSLTLNDLTFTNSGSINGTCPITMSGNLDMSGGNLGNVGDATVAGTFAWKGGIIGSNDGSAAGTVTVSGATTITTNSGKGLYKKTLALNGGAEQTGSGTISFRHSCTMSLPAGQTYLANLSTNNFWTVVSGGTINNAGTFEKQGAGTLSCQPAFNNTGTVQVTAGLLHLSGGGTHSGAFSSSAGSTLEFGGGTHDLSAGTITGTGLLRISSGTVTLPANSGHEDVEATGGTAHFSGTNTMQDLTVGICTVNFAGSLTLNDLTFTNSGSINGTCPITMSGNLDMSAGNLGNEGDATVAGTFAWKGGIIGSNDGSAAGTVTVSGATTITTNSGKGLYKKTLALNGGAEHTGSGTISFRHSCTMSLPAGQTYLANLSTNNFWTVVSGGTINNAGTFEKQGAGTLNIAPTFDNSGVIAGSSTISLTGDFNNTGLISPGASPDILHLNKSAGITILDLAIELEGPNPGVGGYDQLDNSSGAINLNNGTLTVTLLNNYLPVVGTSFTIATGTARTGTFGTLILPVDNARWSVNYNGSNIVLTVEQSLPIELVDFQATKFDQLVRLDWETASERNNRGFGIERSVDGQQFDNIGFVDGKGESDLPVEYNFNDLNPAIVPRLYYRLRQ